MFIRAFCESFAHLSIRDFVFLIPLDIFLNINIRQNYYWCRGFQFLEVRTIINFCNFFHCFELLKSSPSQRFDTHFYFLLFPLIYLISLESIVANCMK